MLKFYLNLYVMRIYKLEHDPQTTVTFYEQIDWFGAKLYSVKLA